MHFVENFDNDQNSHIYDVAAPLARIPDRNGTFFISSEGSHVDSFTGSLKFSSDKQESLVDIKQEDIKSINFYTNFPTQNISQPQQTQMYQSPTTQTQTTTQKVSSYEKPKSKGTGRKI